MNLINEFAKQAIKDGENSFRITAKSELNDERFYMFLQYKIGKAKYIYGDYSYYDDSFYSRINNELELWAIVSDGKIYIDRYKFNIYYLEDHNIKLPKNVEILSSDEQNEYAEDVAFPAFYDSLKTEEIIVDYEIARLTSRARGILFSKDSTIAIPKLEKVFNIQDVANMLCGFTNLEVAAEEKFLEQKGKWTRIKSENEKIRNLMNSTDIAEDWELRMAEGLNSVEAKSVTVEFVFNDKIASIKIEPRVLIRKLVNDDYFSGYDFVVAKQGDKLIKELGASTWRRDKDNEVLTCKHVNKIAYSRKILYER